MTEATGSVGNDGQSEAATSEDGSAAATFTPPATQAELDRIISDRVNRTKSQFKDYQQLKAKAEQFDRVDEANKSELQRAQEAAQAATEQLSSLQLQLSRTTAARDAGLSADDEQFLTGTTAEELAEQAQKLASRIAASQQAQTRAPAPIRGQGASGAGSAVSANDHMNALIRNMRGR